MVGNPSTSHYLSNEDAKKISQIVLAHSTFYDTAFCGRSLCNNCRVGDKGLILREETSYSALRTACDQANMHLPIIDTPEALDVG